jgi:hypothetical protein
MKTIKKTVKTAKKPATVKAAPARTVEVLSKSMISKVKRGYKKAGVSATDETVIAFAQTLIVSGVPVLRRSSSRIARVIKGEVKAEELK